MSSATSAASSQRIKAKLTSLLESGHYYEAHQLYRTLNFRMTNAKKYDELSQLMYDGALQFLKLNQYNSGSDLACLYLDVLINELTQNEDHYSGDHNDSEQILSKIGTLYEMIPAQTQERQTFVTKALRIKHIPVTSVHKKFAVILWHEKNYPESRKHFIHANDDSGRDCALMLVEYQITSGFPSEVDLFIAQYVLQVLCIKRSKELVHQTFRVYTSKHPSINTSDAPFLLPLLNFLWFLFLAIDSGKSATFKVLCDLYDGSLKRDPSYNDYLLQIGQIYFGIENPNRTPRGLFGNLIQSLLEEESPSEYESMGPSPDEDLD